jgi:hypothetical protein
MAAFELVLLLSSFSMAHEHGAHVHGAAAMSIAFDISPTGEAQGEIDLHFPSESLFGFEHKPKDNQQKKKVQDALKQLESQLPTMIVFDPSLSCQIAKKKLEVDYHQEGSGEHSDVDGDFTVHCRKSPEKTQLRFNGFQPFLHLTSYQIQVLVGNQQKSLKHTRNGETLDLN